MATTKDLEAILTDVLEPLSPRKKGSSWYVTSDECVAVINLQKSMYGNQYYINIAAIVRSLDSTPFPKEYNAHVRSRAELLCSAKALERALDLEDESIFDEDRKHIIEKCFRGTILKVIEKLLALDGIRELRTSKNSKKFLIHAKLLALLDAPVK